MRLVSLIAALALLAVPAQGRAEAGLSWMLETCAAVFETGRRAVFGPACAAAPECAGREIVVRGDGAAALRVVVAEGPGEVPGAALCEAAPGTGMLTADWRKVRAWAEKAVAAGRFRPEGAAYRGCARDGRVFHFLPQGGPMAAFRFQLDADAPPCAAQGS